MPAPRAFAPVVRWAGAHRLATACASVLLVGAAGVAAFDWNWLKGPLEHYVSQRTQREFSLGHLDVRLGLAPTVRLDDVRFGNAAWAGPQPMARIDRLEFDVSLSQLLRRKLLLPRLALTGADIALSQAADGRRNWLFSEPSDKSESVFEISSLSVTSGRLHFTDEAREFELDIAADTFDPQSRQQAASADHAPRNDAFRTRLEFSGSFRQGKFNGWAQTGDVLSFQKSGIFFPLRGAVRASTTRLAVDGRIADLAQLSGIDLRLDVQGKTLASFYPFLLLPLPASPPYRLKGHLHMEGNEFRLEEIDGVIGSTDIGGQATYIQRSPRPLLQAQLSSRQLVVSDLGPLIGMQTRESAGRPQPTRPDTATRPAAQRAERRQSGERVLPAGKFDGERLKAIDASVDYRARLLKLTDQLPLESLQSTVKLRDGVLSVDPLRFGLAGGLIDGKLRLDASQATLRSDLTVKATGIEVARLAPGKAGSLVAKGSGRIGASAHLTGTGDSVADVAAAANGHLAVAVSRGRISNLLDALAGLNGGKALMLLLTGDKDIAVHCGTIAFDLEDGVAKARRLAIDTEQTQVLGDGTLSLKDERFDLRVAAKPKRPGILSIRTPIHVSGSFRHPDVGLDKGPLALRAGALLALTTLAPPAALLALVEPGTGEDSGCPRVKANDGLAAGTAKGAAARPSAGS